MPKSIHRHHALRSSGLLGSPLRNLVFGVSFTLVVIMLATIAYWLAGWPFGDAVYMVIVTVYSVGYGEVRPAATPLLRGITLTTIVFGCTGMIFVTSALVQFITVTQLTQILGLKRMNTQIDRLSGHVIVCGYGRIGAALSHDLRASGVAFVVLEHNQETVAHARGLGLLCLHSDATDEDALRAAGIMRARILVTVLADDAANVFITLSARSLNPTVEIIARGELPSTERKLIQAGAHRVVMPTHIGAERIAEMILYRETDRLVPGAPRTQDFERTLRTLGLELEVVVAETDSPVVGQTIAAVEKMASGAFFIVQVNRREGEPVTQPDADMVVNAGDGLVIVGRGARAHALGNLFAAPVLG